MRCKYQSDNNKSGCPSGYRCNKGGWCVLRNKFGGGGGSYGLNDYQYDYANNRFYYGGGNRRGRYGSPCHRHNDCNSRICNKRVGRCERLHRYGRTSDYYFQTCRYNNDCPHRHDKCDKLYSRSWGVCVPKSGSSWRYYNRRCNCRSNEWCNNEGKCVTRRSYRRSRRSCR
ncbi:hypothetical protein ACHAWT_008757, partial [Skeletonema menzelii]